MYDRENAPVIWVNFLVLGLTFLAAITIVPVYGFAVGYDGLEWSVFLVMLAITGFSITVGYHRLWSHRAFKAHPAVRLFLAVFGAAALQNSILNWSADHRNHHKYVDDKKRDPYAATRGFWFSHIGWIIRDYKSGSRNFDHIKDLARDPICQFQHRFYIPLAILVNAGLPLAIGYWHGKLWGTFLLAGILRIVLNHHFTFFINSLAHIWGTRPYSTKDTSRDNPLLALVTYGEGYHNFHHSFQYDYRNGIKWYAYDPGKWIIHTLERLGLATELRRAPRLAIQKARLETQRAQAISHLNSNPALEHLRHSLEDAYKNAVTALEAWNQSRIAWMDQKQILLREKSRSIKGELDQFKIRYRDLKRSCRTAMDHWQQTHASLLNAAVA